MMYCMSLLLQFQFFVYFIIWGERCFQKIYYDGQELYNRFYSSCEGFGLATCTMPTSATKSCPIPLQSQKQDSAFFKTNLMLKTLSISLN